MKNITKTLLVVMALVLAIAAFTACGLFATDCNHTGGTATCEEAAVCDKCGESYGEALGHVEETVEGKDATCDEAGLTEGIKCSICDKVISGMEEIPANGHTYDGCDDTVCNVCEEPREAGTHVYDNACDADCNVCYAERTPADHVWENACDADCNVCSATREPDAHVYDGCEDVNCNVCEEPREAGTHVYDNACDADCNVCYAERDSEVYGHKYEYVWSDDGLTCTATCANDASHTATATVSAVTLNVSASKVTYTYKVDFADANIEDQQKSGGEAAIEPVASIATINAPAIANKVASHDYVKFAFYNEAATYEFTVYYSEVDVWDGTSVSESLSGAGTEENPYLIQSGADLAYIAKEVNALAAMSSAFNGKYFVMTKSIDLNGNALHIGTGSGWKTRQIFAGCLDGNNCSIRGINNTLSLFGCIEGGWAKNLSLYGNVEVPTGNDSIGVFVGYLRLAPLENITNYASINGRGNVGGIVGNMEQSIDAPSKNLVNYGTVTGGKNVGGIAGLLGRYLNDSVNWGDVSGNEAVGGVVSNLYWACTMTNCTNYGTVSGKTYVGGVAGTINGSISATLSNCTNNGDVVGTTCTSTGVDGITSASVTKTNCVNNGDVKISDCTLTHTEAQAATCTATGNVEYWTCSVCEKNYDAEIDGKVIDDVVTPIADHDWDDGVVSGKEITYGCKNCDATKTAAALKDFSYVWSEDNSTCTASATYVNDETSQLTETATVTLVTLNVTATKVTYTYKVEFEDENFEAQTKTVEGDVALVASIATINAPAIANKVASHDYVKFAFYNEAATYEFTIYYSEVDVWDGTSVSTSLEGEGTQEEPYLIQSGADLAYFKSVVDAHNVDGTFTYTHRESSNTYRYYVYANTYFKLTKSIDLGEANFVIGSYVAWHDYIAFAGIFDGNNCTIRGLDVNQKFAGLFAAVYGGTLKNLSVYGASSSTEGYASGVVTYVLAGSTLDNITNYVNVTSTGGDYVGGIAATLEENGGTIQNCVNYGTVTSTAKYVGGIAACARATITGCTNWGNVTATEKSGGVFGFSDKAGLSVSNCINYGTITATSNIATVNGVYGYLSTAVDETKITDCVNYGSVVDGTAE